MLASVGQDFSILDEEPRFLRQRVEHSNPSSSIVQKQKIVWPDSLQQDYKRRLEKERNTYSPYNNAQSVSFIYTLSLDFYGIAIFKSCF